MKHLLSISDLSKDEIVGLLDEADRFHEALDGRELKSCRRCAAVPSLPCSMKTPLAPVPRLRPRVSGCLLMSSTCLPRRRQ